MTLPIGAGEARSRALYFLERRSQWPFWPFLPVVRRRPGQEVELGVVFDALHACGLTGYSATVFLSNLFELPDALEPLLNLPREVFDSAEELIEAGWRVD